MLTVEDIEAWRKSQRLTCKELADIMDVNYFHLAAVLRGQRPLTQKLRKQVLAAMEGRGSGLQVAILPEYEELLRKWAETAGITVEELVQELLADALKIRGAKKTPCETGGTPAGGTFCVWVLHGLHTAAV